MSQYLIVRPHFKAPLQPQLPPLEPPESAVDKPEPETFSPVIIAIIAALASALVLAVGGVVATASVWCVNSVDR